MMTLSWNRLSRYSALKRSAVPETVLIQSAYKTWIQNWSTLEKAYLQYIHWVDVVQIQKRYAAHAIMYSHDAFSGNISMLKVVIELLDVSCTVKHQTLVL
eukprot:gb/GECG01003068.1/.p1 GENE.gb/GECG01003068.1/~~gb/GECG01003068.1/.p1  ORF type:complete len:100 (+),score=3.22 gb/GECG01003068.1/:1-300(+)